MRNALIVVGVAVVAIGIGVLVFMYGGEDFSNTPVSETTENQVAAVIVPFTELAHGTQSNVSTRINYLITSASNLEKLWKMIDAKGKAPAVDFVQNSVAAVFAGEKATAGYAISVSKVIDAQNRLMNVTLVSPDSTCVLAHATTSPYQIVKVPKTSLPFAHEDQTITTDCPQ